MYVQTFPVSINILICLYIGKKIITLETLLMLDMVIRLDRNCMAVNVMEGDTVFIATYSGGAVVKLIVQDETIKQPPTWKATCME